VTSVEAFAAYLELARGDVGLSAATSPDAFAAICAPLGPSWARAFYLQHAAPGGENSPCTTVALQRIARALAAAGSPALQQPLDGTGATGLLARHGALAKAHGAYRTAVDPGPGLRVGCVVHAEDAHGRHTRCLVERAGPAWRTVDGTLEDGWGVVRAAETVYEPGLVDRAASSKPVLFWIDVPAFLASLLGQPADGAVA